MHRGEIPDVKNGRGTSAPPSTEPKPSLFNNPLISEADLTDPNGFQYDPEIINNIDRFGNSDRWFCDKCTLRDDKFGMMQHPCKQKDKSEAS